MTVIELLLQADRLLAIDQVDAAEAIYQRVADLDRMDAIAVVGLARCALARGHDRRAHELAARALEIDPANDMARRMEARLSEILVTRGDIVERPAAASEVEGLPMRAVTTPSTPSREAGRAPGAPQAPRTPAPGVPAGGDPGRGLPGGRSAAPAAEGSSPAAPPSGRAASGASASRRGLWDRLRGR